MDIVIGKKELLRLVQRCQGVADKKSTMPVLSNVLLEAENGSLRASATDNYLSITGSSAAEVKRPGAVAIPAKELFERVKAMPEGSVQITRKDDKGVVLKSLGAARRYTLPCIPGEDFPKLPTSEAGSPALTLPAEKVASLIYTTHFSIALDETRPHVNSALLEWGGDTVRMVSTDGHRLSKLEVKLDGALKAAKMLIPLRAVQELRRIADGAAAFDGSKIAITQSGHHAFFDVGGVVFSATLVDAQFPPYQQVIPASTTREARMSREALLDAVRAVSVAASERTGGVKMTLGSGMCRISSESPEHGNGFDEVETDDQGEERILGVAGKYLIDALTAMTSEDVTFGFSGELDPILIRPGDGTDYVAVIMPMRV